MEKSTTIIEIAKALAKFQGEVKSVKKDGNNPFFKSKYATLENVIETAREALTKSGLSFSQFPCGENELTTILMHESGEFLQSTVKMSPKDNTPQGQGSAITYMRRYALSAILGLATEEDDDGNSASNTKSKIVPPVITKKTSENMSGNGVCSICKAQSLISPKTGNAYCPNWKTHKANKERNVIIPSEYKEPSIQVDEEFFKSMPEQK